MSISVRKAPSKGPASEIMNLGDVQLQRDGAKVKITIGAETRELPLTKLSSIVNSLTGLANRAQQAARK